MIAGYARVSTHGQARDGNSLESQEAALRAAGATEIFADAFTGVRASRPELDRLLGLLQAGDTLIVTKFDRIARSLVAGIELIDSLSKKNVTVNVLNMGVIDDSPGGRLLRNVMLSFAEYEREMILERTQEGKRIARGKPGFRDGRPPIGKGRIEHALALLETNTYRQVKEITGISVATLCRYVKKRKEARLTQC